MGEDVIARVTTEVSEKPLVAIDSLLDALGSSELRERKVSLQPLLDLFCDAVLACDDAGGTPGQFPSVSLFSGNLSQPKRRFVAICLLRLLSRNRDCLRDTGFALKAHALLDDALSKDVYPQCGVQVNDQNYKKERELCEVVPRVEEEVSRLINFTQ